MHVVSVRHHSFFLGYDSFHSSSSSDRPIPETRVVEAAIPREYIILAGGKSLMSSRMHGSEEALATLACRRAQTMEQPSPYSPPSHTLLPTQLPYGHGIGYPHPFPAYGQAVSPQPIPSVHQSATLTSSTYTPGQTASPHLFPSTVQTAACHQHPCHHPLPSPNPGLLHTYEPTSTVIPPSREHTGTSSLEARGRTAASKPELAVLCNELAFLPIATVKALVLQLCGRVFDDVDLAPVQERRLKLLQCWLRTDSEPSWAKLVAALKAPALEQIALAESIRSKYCSDLPQ